MAKRKNTQKTSQDDAKDQVDDTLSTDVNDSISAETENEIDGDDLSAKGDAADVGAPSDDTKIDGDDDTIELKEPTEIEGDPKANTDDDAEEANSVSEDSQAEEPPVEAEVEEATEADNLPLAPQVIRETTIERKGGFVPMLLGGAVAAGLGYGTAAYVSQDLWPFAQANGFEDEIRATMSEQQTALSDVTTRLSGLENAEAPTVDLGPVQDDIAALGSQTDELVASVNTRLDELAARIDTLEKQPVEQAVSPEAIAAYERALDDLRAEIDAQREEVARMAEEAVAAEGNAEEQARLAAARAAMAEVTAALDTGAAFSDAVDTLQENGVDVPEGLVSVADEGIATQGSLIDSFPEVARDALANARSAATETAEGTSRVATFLRNQLGARSVAPREGDDPDAVLSRAEAAVRAGDLDNALSELSTLPEVAQPAVAEWQARAQTRLEAKTAAAELAQQLTQN